MIITNFASLEIPFAKYKPSTESLARFRKWHVESLLNQAADLLDRCVRERSQYRSLMARWDLLELEMEREKKAIELLDEKVNKKMLDLKISKLEAEHAAKNNATTLYDSVISHYKSWNHPKKNPESHYGYGLTDSVTIEKNINAADADIISKQLTWEREDREFRKREIDDTRSIWNRRNTLMESGSLNFKMQAKPIAIQIEDDFKDAYDRIIVAYRGLTEFYGFHKDSQNTPPPSSDSTDPGKLIDSSVIWIRKAIRWLVAFGQLDQGWSAIFSLRSIVGDRNWEKIQTKEGVATISFKLPSEAFDTHHFVRLRGISIFVRTGKNNDRPWSASIELPQNALSRQMWDEYTEFTKIQQGDLPTCYIGRVEQRSSPRPPEIAGLVSLNNASPIGEDNPSGLWRIQIQPASKSTDLSTLEDIEIELNLVGRPQ